MKECYAVERVKCIEVCLSELESFRVQFGEFTQIESGQIITG